MSDSADGITVTGYGVSSAAPDVFVAVLAAEASRRRPADALDAAAAALGRMRAVAGPSAGEGGLSTQRTTLSQAYDREGKLRGYEARLAMSVRTPDVAQAGVLLTRCIDAGGDEARLDSTSFEHADSDHLVIAARAAAFADARARAAQLAELAGRELGAVQSIDETQGMPIARFAMARGAAMSAKSVPMDAGELDVRVTLTVHWTWADRMPS